MPGKRPGTADTEVPRVSGRAVPLWENMAFFEKEDSVCLFEPRTVVRVGELNLQQVETEAGLFLDSPTFS